MVLWREVFLFLNFVRVLRGAAAAVFALVEPFRRGRKLRAALAAILAVAFQVRQRVGRVKVDKDGLLFDRDALAPLHTFRSAYCIRLQQNFEFFANGLIGFVFIVSVFLSGDCGRERLSQIIRPSLNRRNSRFTGIVDGIRVARSLRLRVGAGNIEKAGKCRRFFHNALWWKLS